MGHHHSTMTDASYIIVPGASALPFFYDFVVKPLQAKGISIEALHIPSVGLEHGNRPGPLPDMYDDAEFVANRIQELSDAGEDVIVVTHSYGGTPGTQAIEGLTKTERTKEGKKGGVIGLAYMTSLVPSVGETASSVLASVPEENLVPTLIDVSFIHLPRLRNANSKFDRRTAGCTTPIYQDKPNCHLPTYPKLKANTGPADWPTTRQRPLPVL